MVFEVNKCINNTDAEAREIVCASPDEIDEFISKVKIETWVNQYETNFD